MWPVRAAGGIPARIRGRGIACERRSRPDVAADGSRLARLFGLSRNRSNLDGGIGGWRELGEELLGG